MQLLYFFKIFFKVFSFLCLFTLNHFFLLSFLDAFFIALHNNSYKNVLDCGVEEDHEKNKINLSWQSLCPRFKKRIVNNITVQKRKKCNY